MLYEVITPRHLASTSPLWPGSSGAAHGRKSNKWFETRMLTCIWQEDCYSFAWLHFWTGRIHIKQKSHAKLHKVTIQPFWRFFPGRGTGFIFWQIIFFWYIMPDILYGEETVITSYSIHYTKLYDENNLGTCFHQVTSWLKYPDANCFSGFKLNHIFHG